MAPSGWTIDTIGELCDVATGGTPSRGRGDFWEGDIPWMSSGEIHQRRVTHTKEAITAAGLAASNARWVPKDAVMIALNGQGKTRGTVAILERPMTCNQSLAAIQPNGSRLLPDYLLHYLSAKYTAIRQLTGDGGRNGLNLKHIRSIPVTYPDLPEQRKIAAILSSVDDAIEKTQAVIDQVQVVKRGVMQELLTRGLPGRHTRFKQTEAGEIPEEWEVVELSSVASVERGKFAHRPRNDPRFYGGQYPFIQTGDVAACDGLIRTYHQTLNEDGLAVSRLFPRGTIVVTIAANIGSTGIAGLDVAFPDSLVGIRPGPRIDTRFLELVLRTRKRVLDRFAPESAQKNINLNTLKPLKIPLPDMAEQTKIADCVWSIIMSLRNARDHMEGLTRLKVALMARLLTGELRVTPNPETD